MGSGPAHKTFCPNLSLPGALCLIRTLRPGSLSFRPDCP
jgi:hypothetical protein